MQNIPCANINVPDMKKFSILFLLLSLVLVGCKSNEEKAAELIKKELSKTLYDFESYSPIETIVTEAKQSVYTDTTFFNSAGAISITLKLAAEELVKSSNAQEKMDIWGKPSYSSSLYSDQQYRKYEKEYNEHMGRFLAAWFVVKSMEQNLKDTLQSIDPEKSMGWEVIHKFRCKSRGGYSSIANYRYIIDKDFENVILCEDMDEDDSKKIRKIIKKIENEGLTTDDL